MEELSETLKTGIEATYIDLEKLERASGVTKEAMQGVSVGANDTALAVQDQLLQTEEIQKKVDVVNDANEQIVRQYAADPFRFKKTEIRTWRYWYKKSRSISKKWCRCCGKTPDTG